MPVMDIEVSSFADLKAMDGFWLVSLVGICVIRMNVGDLRADVL